eukprot:TRINITY_DN8887_c0_g1_i1.p1 TRINITY_DN8887_c0_g1~~TRINITY_DN8887_c0_g1_i1.p1  ORF type:complete len:385 (+),score=27.73 TRINITY_DN8887_c0_g1_i1:73-1227(+)
MYSVAGSPRDSTPKTGIVYQRPQAFQLVGDEDIDALDDFEIGLAEAYGKRKIPGVTAPPEQAQDSTSKGPMKAAPIPAAATGNISAYFEQTGSAVVQPVGDYVLVRKFGPEQGIVNSVGSACKNPAIKIGEKVRVVGKGVSAEQELGPDMKHQYLFREAEIDIGSQKSPRKHVPFLNEAWNDAPNWRLGCIQHNVELHPAHSTVEAYSSPRSGHPAAADGLLSAAPASPRNATSHGSPQKSVPPASPRTPRTPRLADATSPRTKAVPGSARPTYFVCSGKHDGSGGFKTPVEDFLLVRKFQQSKGLIVSRGPQCVNPMLIPGTVVTLRSEGISALPELGPQGKDQWLYREADLLVVTPVEKLRPDVGNGKIAGSPIHNWRLTAL